jgi:hypothetical protein
MKQSQEIKNSVSKQTNNPFQIKLLSLNQNLDYELFLSNMETSLKEIILIENDEIDNNSDSSFDNQPLYIYPSEHSSDYDISDFEL